MMVGSKQHVKNYLQLANFDYGLGKAGFFEAWALGPVQRGTDTKRWSSLRRVGSEQIPKSVGSKVWNRALSGI